MLGKDALNFLNNASIEQLTNANFMAHFLRKLHPSQSINISTHQDLIQFLLKALATESGGIYLKLFHNTLALLENHANDFKEINTEQAKKTSLMIFNLRKLCSQAEYKETFKKFKFQKFNFTILIESFSTFMAREPRPKTYDNQYNVAITQNGVDLLVEMGKLAEAQCLGEGLGGGNVGASNIGRLLNEFSLRRNLHPRYIGMMFEAIGKLAQAKALDGKLQPIEDSEGFQWLLIILANTQENLKPEHIRMVFWGLGELAATGHLEGEMNVAVLEWLLDRLSEQEELSFQDIGIALSGFSKLAKNHFNNQQARSLEIQELLDRLTQLVDLDFPYIRMAFEGLEELAKENRLEKGQIHVVELQWLLRKLEQINHPYFLYNTREVQELRSVFARLTATGHLKGHEDVDQDALELEENRGVVTLKVNQQKRLTPLIIRAVLWGLGRLTEVGGLNGKVSIKTIQWLLKRLDEQNEFSSQDIVKTLRTLQLLMERRHLLESLDDPEVGNYLGRLVLLLSEKGANTRALRDCLLNLRLLSSRVPSLPSNPIMQNAMKQLILLKDQDGRSCLDLHGLSEMSAYLLTKSWLERGVPLGLNEIGLIVGKGIHTKEAQLIHGEHPVFRGVKRALSELKIPFYFDPKNEGILLTKPISPVAGYSAQLNAVSNRSATGGRGRGGPFSTPPVVRVEPDRGRGPG